MSRPDQISLVSQLTEVLSRTITSLTPLQSTSGAFLADARRVDPYPATPQDITLNRAMYALARLPDIDDPLNPYFNDDGLRDRAIRVGAYLAEALGDTGGIPTTDASASRIQSGVNTSGLHSMNFWTCPHTVRFWLRSTLVLYSRLTDPQKTLWRDSIDNCAELLAGRTPSIPEWGGLQSPRAMRLGSAAATGLALIDAGRLLNHDPYLREGKLIWRQVLERILQSGDDASIVDGLDIDALLGLLNAAHDSSEEARRAVTRLARWRTRLTMPDGGVNELFDRQRAYSRFGMAAAVPGLFRNAHLAAVAAILESFHQRPRRGNQALVELSVLAESIEALLPKEDDASRAAGSPVQAALSAPFPRLSTAVAMQRLQELEFGWFGGEASRAWLFRGNGWIAGCRAPVACAAGFSNPWSVRHLRVPCWIDGSAPEARRLPLFDTSLHPIQATEGAKRTLAIHGDGFHSRFSVNVIDGETLRMSARVNWALPSHSRVPTAIQTLLQQKEGDRILIRDPSGHTTPLDLTLEPIQHELPSGSQLELPVGERTILLAVQTSAAAPILRWNMPIQPGSERLSVAPGRLELSLPITGGQETRLEMTLSVPH